MAVWLDSRACKDMDTLKSTGEFVIVDTTLHDEFDNFKKERIDRKSSYLNVNGLLKFYLHHNNHLKSNLVMMYKNTYLKLKDVDVDDLCKWVSQMREEFKCRGSHVFQNPTFGASLRVLAHACKTDACLTL